MKKGQTADIDRDVSAYLNGLSKQALIDCLHDALELIEGVQGGLRLPAVRKHCKPRLDVRGDRDPKPENR